MTKIKHIYNIYKDKLRHVITRVKTYSNWYTLIWPLTRLLPIKRIIRLRGGWKIMARSIFGEDFTVIHEMFYRDDYGLKRVVPLQNNAPVILDLGANIGAFTLLAAQCFPKAKFFSFEPEARNYASLKYNIQLNNLEGKINAINSAVAEHAGERNFYISNYEYAHSLLQEQVADGNRGALTVHCTTITKIFEDYHLETVDILKLDIEGSEYAVLYQLPKYFYEKIGIICLEIHVSRENKSEDLIAFLGQQGFKVFPSLTHPRVFIFAKNTEQIKY